MKHLSALPVSSAVVCLLFLAGDLSPAAAQSPAFRVHSLAVDAALEKYEQAKREFERTKRLVATGTASRQLLRKHRYDQQMAELDYYQLVAPDREEEIALERSRIILQLRLEEFEVVRRLYQRGAASELEFRRSRTWLEIASLNHEYLSEYGDMKMLVFEIAHSKFTLAAFEFTSARRLVDSGSISRTVFDRVSAEYFKLRNELDSARRGLGADATIIDL